MRTDSEYMRELTDEELGDLVGFFELLLRIDRRLKSEAALKPRDE